MFASTALFPDSLVPVTSPEGVASAENPAAVDPDAELMREVAGGSEAAFVQLVQRHQRPLLNFFARMGVSSDGEDLVQETFVRLFRYRRNYRPSARFTTFLYVLARNVWADRGRRVVRLERLASHLEREMEIAAQPVRPGASEGIDVDAALARLSPKLREVVVLNIYQGMRYQEVADVLGIPLGTVKSRLNLALTELRQIIHAS